MDRQTLAAYDADAVAFAKEWHEQPAPSDLHEIVARFFIRGGISADIGCGSGREVAWLNANGFPALGFDASEGLLAEARSRYIGPIEGELDPDIRISALRTSNCLTSRLSPPTPMTMCCAKP